MDRCEPTERRGLRPRKYRLSVLEPRLAQMRVEIDKARECN
jgi:hypothetical protein